MVLDLKARSMESSEDEVIHIADLVCHCVHIKAIPTQVSADPERYQQSKS